MQPWIKYLSALIIYHPYSYNYMSYWGHETNPDPFLFTAKLSKWHHCKFAMSHCMVTHQLIKWIEWQRKEWHYQNLTSKVIYILNSLVSLISIINPLGNFSPRRFRITFPKTKFCQVLLCHQVPATCKSYSSWTTSYNKTLVKTNPRIMHYIPKIIADQ